MDLGATGPPGDGLYQSFMNIAKFMINTKSMVEQTQADVAGMCVFVMQGYGG